MKITQSIHSRLIYMFSDKSKFDGRLLIVVAILCYFGLLFGSGTITDYTSVWHKLGVPAAPERFTDLGNVISGFECTRRGYDVLFENPCDPINSATPVMYPRIWMTLTPLGIDQNMTFPIGIALTLMLYASVFILIGKINHYEALCYSLILCSPPVMLLVERGNVDIIIFLLLFLAWVLLCKSKRSAGRYIAYSLMSLAACLKLFPIFGLPIILRERGKVFIISAAIFVTPFIIYSFSHAEDLRQIKSIVHVTNYHSYGYKVMFMDMKRWLTSPYYLTARGGSLIALQVLFLVAVFIVAFRLIIAKLPKFKDFTARRFQSAIVGYPDDKAACYIDSFRLGCGLYIGTFLLGSVHDYKLVFLLFTIPQMLYWIKENGKMSLPTSFALLGILSTLFLSAFYNLIFDEVINWALLVYFAWSFMISLPTRIKFLTHATLSFTNQ